MLQSGNSLRLDAKEKKVLKRVAGTNPDYIKSPRQLNLYIDAHQVQYSGSSAEERLLSKILQSFKADSAD